MPRLRPARQALPDGGVRVAADDETVRLAAGGQVVCRTKRAGKSSRAGLAGR